MRSLSEYFAVSVGLIMLATFFILLMLTFDISPKGPARYVLGVTISSAMIWFAIGAALNMRGKIPVWD